MSELHACVLCKCLWALNHNPLISGRLGTFYVQNSYRAGPVLWMWHSPSAYACGINLRTEPMHASLQAKWSTRKKRPKCIYCLRTLVSCLNKKKDRDRQHRYGLFARQERGGNIYEAGRQHLRPLCSRGKERKADVLTLTDGNCNTESLVLAIRMEVTMSE